MYIQEYIWGISKYPYSLHMIIFQILGIIILIWNFRITQNPERLQSDAEQGNPATVPQSQ